METQIDFTDKNLHLISIEDKATEKLKAERAIVHYITTPDIDKGRDVVEPKGMDDSEFGKTVFYNHNYNLPIAKNIYLKATDNGVKAKTVFSKSNQFADDIYNLHLEDIISTWSIGFLPKGSIEYDEKKNIYRIKEWRLFEYSSAPLAMNGEAKDIEKSVEDIKKIIKSAEALQELELFRDKTIIKAEYDESKIKSLIDEAVNVSNTEIINLKSELNDLKNQIASKNVKPKSKLDIGNYINELLTRDYEQRTGRKFKQ